MRAIRASKAGAVALGLQGEVGEIDDGGLLGHGGVLRSME